MHLLDTNIVSELRKPKPHGAVVGWFVANPLNAASISAITLYELQTGAERVRQQDAIKAQELDRWIGEVEQSITVIPLGIIEARMTAYLMRSCSQDLLTDAMIAATAIANGLTVATRNTRDFERFGVPLVNPFLFPRN
jgi:predicted nucleic acid-binding protein